MKTEAKEKAFDCVKWTRSVRDRIYEETKHMSNEERLRWYNRRPSDPFLAELWHRLKAPKSSGIRVAVAGGQGAASDSSDESGKHDE